MISILYYVSPPIDQYLKFKNHCSLVHRTLELVCCIKSIRGQHARRNTAKKCRWTYLEVNLDCVLYCVFSMVARIAAGSSPLSFTPIYYEKPISCNMQYTQKFIRAHFSCLALPSYYVSVVWYINSFFYWACPSFTVVHINVMQMNGKCFLQNTAPKTIYDLIKINN